MFDFLKKILFANEKNNLIRYSDKMEKYKEKIDSLRIDFNELYSMTNSLNEKDSELKKIKHLWENSFNNTPDIILIFDNKGCLEKMNNNAIKMLSDYFKIGENFNKLLKYLNIPFDNSAIQETYNTYKHSFRSRSHLNLSIFRNKMIDIITIPVFKDINKKILSNVILEIRDTSEIIKSKINFNLHLDKINLTYWKINNYSFEKLIKSSDFLNIFGYIYECDEFSKLTNYLNKITHPDDFKRLEEIFTDVILTNCEKDFNLSFRVRSNDNKEFMLFVGKGNIKNLSNDDDFELDKIKRRLRLSGTLLDLKKFNRLENKEKFHEEILKINNLYLNFTKDREKNIINFLDYLKKILNISNIVYVKNDLCNCTSNFITSTNSQQNLEKFITKNKKFMKKFYLSNKVNILDKKNDDKYIYSAIKSFSLDFENYGFLFLYDDKKMIFDDYKYELLDIVCSFIKEEDCFIFDYYSFDDIFKYIIDMSDKWIWIKDMNNEILFINKNLRCDLIRYFCNGKDFLGDRVSILKEIFSCLPDNIKEIFLSSQKNERFMINKNIEIEIKNKLVINKNNKIWLYFANKI